MHVLQVSIGAMKIRVKNELQATRLFLTQIKPVCIACNSEKCSNNTGRCMADVYHFNGQLSYTKKNQQN